MSEVEDINNTMVKPFDETDIKEGDTILKVNEVEVESIENLQEELNKCERKKR